MRKIFFDIETTGFLTDPNAEITLLAVYDTKTEEYSSFLFNELNRLWPILEEADMFVGYNSDRFDIPFLNRHYPGDLSQIKSLDILEEIRKSLGRRVKLGLVAEATIGAQKSADGLIAQTWWKNGEIDKVRDYCIQDVRVTKGIYDYAKEHGKLKYKEDGNIIEFDIDTSKWEKGGQNAITRILPF